MEYGFIANDRYYVTKFMEDYNEYTKKQLFMKTLREIQRELKREGKEGLNIIFEVEYLKQLTKVPKTLISQLLNEKVLIEKGKEYKFNNKIFYCYYCEEFNQIGKFKKEQNPYYNNKDYDSKLYEYEIEDHLINEHQQYKTEYSNDYKNKWKKSTVTEKTIKEFIREDKPKFKVHDHDLEITD